MRLLYFCQFLRQRTFVVATIAASLFLNASWAQDTQTSANDSSETQQTTGNNGVTDEQTGGDESEAGRPGELQFSFDGTPWRDVVKWLADSGDLALRISVNP